MHATDEQHTNVSVLFEERIYPVFLCLRIHRGNIHRLLLTSASQTAGQLTIGNQTVQYSCKIQYTIINYSKEVNRKTFKTLQLLGCLENETVDTFEKIMFGLTQLIYIAICYLQLT